MKLYHYFAVGLKVFAMALLIYGISYLSPLLEIYKTGTVNGIVANSTYYIVNAGLIFFVAGYLWLFPVSTSKWFLGPQQELEVTPISNNDIVTAVVLTIGLYIFAWGIIDLIYWLSFLYLFSGLEPEYEAMAADSKANIVATVVQLVIGLGMILKSKSLAKAITKVAA